MVSDNVVPNVGDEIHFADPFKSCNACTHQVTGVTIVDEGMWPNIPCGHPASYRDLCPSWGPVDGCSCERMLGYVPHPSVEQLQVSFP